MPRIYYTLEEANKILPEIKNKLMDLIELKEAIAVLGTINISFDDLEEDYLNNIKMGKKFHKLHYNFFKLLEELEGGGVFIKDLSQGLIDFYSKFEGRDILLCWKFGENEINYWHEIADGFNGRQPVDILKKENEN